MRETSIRWDERRCAAYAEFLDAVEACQVQGQETALAYAVHQDKGGEDPFPTLEALRETEKRLWKAWRYIEILGSEAVVQVGRTVINPVRNIPRLENAAYVYHDPGAFDRLGEAQKEASSALDAFLAAVRTELGIVEE